MAQDDKKTLFSNRITGELRHRSRKRREGLADVAAVETRARPPRNDLRPELGFVYRSLDSLKPASRKLRKLVPAHVAAICESIAQLGICSPVLINADGELIDGHAVCQAAAQLGITQVPCIVVDHLTREEQRLLRVAINRLAEKGTWDLYELKIELEELIELVEANASTALKASRQRWKSDRDFRGNRISRWPQK